MHAILFALRHLGLATAVTSLAVAPFFVGASLLPADDQPPPGLRDIVAGMPLPRSPAGIKDFVLYNLNIGVRVARQIEKEVAAEFAAPPSTAPTQSATTDNKAL
jgi:hypothetical protein